MAIIDFRFSSQNLFLSEAARFSNCALPSCRASARSSRAESFESRSRLEEEKVSKVQAGFGALLVNSRPGPHVTKMHANTRHTSSLVQHTDNSTHTFSMFLPMMPMTSSTCSCCCFIFLAAWICLICSGPGIGFPSGPSGRSPAAGGPPGAPAAFSSPPFPDITLQTAARIWQRISYPRKSNSRYVYTNHHTN